ncbi:uncharacterized protein LOC128305922 [Anopheles moucheti]|uniref:uncharacterized protein LOC128305922 n=1 Tax=Anopheles moucheti TaxID=186751 RepID=UPI0022F051E7|nr:uncharacterized protein LOC128305922 [Anopheles moucheti]
MRTALFLFVFLQTVSYVVTVHLECRDCICTITNWNPGVDGPLAVDWILRCEMDLYFVNLTTPTIALDHIDRMDLVSKFYINIAKSPIQNVYMSSRAKIFRLTLTETNLTDIRFECQNNKLEFFTIIESRISVLPDSIKLLSNVKAIHVLKSFLKFIDFSLFSKLSHLEHISLSYNEIESLQFPDGQSEDFGKLKDILLSNNFLTTVSMNNFNNMRALETLDLSNNRIVSFEGHLESNSLRNLDLSHNRFDALSFCGWNLTGLTKFDANNNILMQLPACMETTMSSVSYLMLSSNVLSGGEIWPQLATMTNLQMLDVSHNRLTSLVWCSTVLSLRFVTARNNQIKELRVPFAKEGFNVDAGCNAIEQFDPSSMSPNVTFLQMQCNPLDCSWNRDLMNYTGDAKCVKNVTNCKSCQVESEIGIS